MQAHAVATPRLAKTCEAVRPTRGSAVPSLCFLWYPKRVASQVRMKTINKTVTARNPTVPQSSKHMPAPTMAPDRVTPRTVYARTENVTEAARASHQFPVFVCAITAKTVRTAERSCETPRNRDLGDL